MSLTLGCCKESRLASTCSVADSDGALEDGEVETGRLGKPSGVVSHPFVPTFSQNLFRAVDDSVWFHYFTRVAQELKQ